MNCFNKRDLLDKVAYFLLFATIIMFLPLAINNSVVSGFFKDTENKSFDYRQSLLVKNRHLSPSKDIVIISIDDASYEYILDKYGEWPIPRYIYADMLNLIEKQNPKAVIFDLMFIKSRNSSTLTDKYLTDTFNKYNNIYTAMNLDNQAPDVRYPINLPEKVSVKLQNNSDKVNVRDWMSFSNCRPILKTILNGNSHVGMVNIKRSNDGIVRQIPTFFYYKGNYYPYLSLLAGKDLVSDKNNNEFVIDKNSNLLINDKKIPLLENGEVILNWYGKAGRTYQNIPFYKMVEASKSKNLNYDFTDKIVYIGTTAVSLYDAKSTPIDRIYPGVEIHATYLNNILDNSFIKKTPLVVDITIITILALIVWIIVMQSISAVFASISVALIATIYYLISYYLMKYLNLWIIIVLPLVTMIVTFGLAYLAKYLIKSKDFEHQYKLATTDGLTELYNHRYFQDTIKQQVDQSKRYEKEFSLIMIDIDFFKTFNDKYGHQAGDAVLKQVAQVLKKNTRSSDYVCRYGGEEMAIILPNTNYEETMINAERIRKEIEKTSFKLSSTQEEHVTVSMGVATFPECGNTSQDIIKFADEALYYAKENGRNQVGKNNR